MSSTSLQNQIAAVITFNGVHRRSIELHDGDRLIVGSEESCDIVLNAECVAATHCVIGAEAGVVSVQDCYSESGTFVNGNRIRQTELTGQTELQIGTVNISVAVRNLGSPEPAHQPTNSEAVESRSLSPEDPVELPVDQIEELKKSFGLEPAATASEGHQTDSEDRTVHDLQAQLDDAIAENAVLQNRLESMAATSATPANDPYQEEMIELLRAEVLDLQAALEATAENAVQTPEEVSQHFDDDALPRADAERLVERLERPY